MMASSSGCSMSLMLGTTRIRKVHLPTKPFVSAEYAAWGCDSAMIERCLISSTHFSTLAEMNDLQNSSVPRGAPRCFFPSTKTLIPISLNTFFAWGRSSSLTSASSSLDLRSIQSQGPILKCNPTRFLGDIVDHPQLHHLQTECAVQNLGVYR